MLKVFSSYATICSLLLLLQSTIVAQKWPGRSGKATSDPSTTSRQTGKVAEPHHPNHYKQSDVQKIEIDNYTIELARSARINQLSSAEVLKRKLMQPFTTSEIKLIALTDNIDTTNEIDQIKAASALEIHAPRSTLEFYKHFESSTASLILVLGHRVGSSFDVSFWENAALGADGNRAQLPLSEIATYGEQRTKRVFFLGCGTRHYSLWGISPQPRVNSLDIVKAFAKIQSSPGITSLHHILDSLGSATSIEVSSDQVLESIDMIQVRTMINGIGGQTESLEIIFRRAEIPRDPDPRDQSQHPDESIIDSFSQALISPSGLLFAQFAFWGWLAFRGLPEALHRLASTACEYQVLRKFAEFGWQLGALVSLGWACYHGTRIMVWIVWLIFTSTGGVFGFFVSGIIAVPMILFIYGALPVFFVFNRMNLDSEWSMTTGSPAISSNESQRGQLARSFSFLKPKVVELKMSPGTLIAGLCALPTLALVFAEFLLH